MGTSPWELKFTVAEKVLYWSNIILNDLIFMKCVFLRVHLCQRNRLSVEPWWLVHNVQRCIQGLLEMATDFGQLLVVSSEPMPNYCLLSFSTVLLKTPFIRPLRLRSSSRWNCRWHAKDMINPSLSPSISFLYDGFVFLLFCKLRSLTWFSAKICGDIWCGRLLVRWLSRSRILVVWSKLLDFLVLQREGKFLLAFEIRGWNSSPQSPLVEALDPR